MSRPSPIDVGSRGSTAWSDVLPGDDGLPSPSHMERAASVAYVSSEQIPRLDDPGEAAGPGLLQDLASSKWDTQFKALNTVRSLALHHPAELTDRLLSDVVLAVVKLAASLRSSVSKNSLMTLNDMCVGLGAYLEPEMKPISHILLKRAADHSNIFISAAANEALISLADNSCKFITRLECTG